jgi:GTP 3',8-cyclase
MGLDKFEIDRKIFSHKDHLLKFLDGNNFYPVNIEIDPTNACNEKCIWCCWEDHRKDKTTMSKDLLEKIVHELSDVGVKSINWTGGGESLLNKNTLNSMILAKSLGIQNGIFTNGTLVNDYAAKVLVENCEWVRTSLGSASEETFFKCHGLGGSDFSRIIDGISYLKKFKDELKSNVTLGVSMVTVKENFHELYKEAELAKRLGANYFQGKPDLRMGSEDFSWWDNEVMPLFIKAKNDFEDESFKVLIAQYTQDKYGLEGTRFRDSGRDSLNISESQKSKCYVHNFVTAITANGDVAFCKNLRDEKKYILGNLKSSSFREIWDSERKKEIEKEINSVGCGVFCQNGKLNENLRYIKSFPTKDQAIDYINSVEKLGKDMHPNFL